MSENKEVKNELAVINIDKSPKLIEKARLKQNELVVNHPFIEIIDSKTFAKAKENRTALKKGRTELANGQKAIISRVEAFKKDLKTETESLVSITRTAEERQDNEVKRWEKQKADEKAEKERKEKELKDKQIKSVVDFKSKWINIVKNASLEDVSSIPEVIIKDAEELEVGEFAPSIQIALNEISEKLKDKKESLEVAEKNRIEAEKLEKEKKDLKEKQDAIDKRETEIKKKEDAEAKILKDKKEAQDKKDRELKEAKEKLELEKKQIKWNKERTKLLSPYSVFIPEKNKDDDFGKLSVKDWEKFFKSVVNAKEAQDKKIAADKAEAERKEALRPDKEKANTFIDGFDALLEVVPLGIKDENVANALFDYIEESKKLQEIFKTKINNL